MTNDDIWSNDSDVISSEVADTSDGDIEEGVVLDLSEDAELGTEYPVIPLRSYVHCRVYEATQKVSQKGNDMYALVLRATDDEWGKNRQLRFWITLSSSALAFTLPSLAALGVPAQFNGEPVTTVKELRKTKEAAGGSGRLVFPSVGDLMDQACYAYIGKHEPDENDDEKIWERVTKLAHVDDPRRSVSKSGVVNASSNFSNPYAS